MFCSEIGLKVSRQEKGSYMLHNIRFTVETGKRWSMMIRNFRRQNGKFFLWKGHSKIWSAKCFPFPQIRRQVPVHAIWWLRRYWWPMVGGLLLSLPQILSWQSKPIRLIRTFLQGAIYVKTIHYKTKTSGSLVAGYGPCSLRRFDRLRSITIAWLFTTHQAI